MQSGYFRFLTINHFAHIASKIKAPEYVFVGDSLAVDGRCWGCKLGSPLGSINLGVAGYTTHQMGLILPRAAQYSPKHIVIMSGTNDPTFDADAWQRVMGFVVAHPRITFLLSTVPQRDDINAGLRQLKRPGNALLVDVAAACARLGPAAFKADGVHLSQLGVEAWSMAIESTTRN